MDIIIITIAIIIITIAIITIIKAEVPHLHAASCLHILVQLQKL